MEIVASIESVVTILAILLGGAYAIFKLGVFRDLKPHLTITQNVSHRRIGSSYIHIAVMVGLHNSSKVAIEMRKSFSRLQAISPLTDESIEQLYDDAFNHDDAISIWWPTLEVIEDGWDKGGLIIERGESHSETYEFVIEARIETILVYTYFHNPKYAVGKNMAEGWEAKTVYDVITRQGATYDSNTNEDSPTG